MRLALSKICERGFRNLAYDLIKARGTPTPDGERRAQVGFESAAASGELTEDQLALMFEDGATLVDHRGDSWPVDARDTNALPGEDADAGLYERTVETAPADDGKGGGKDDGGGAAADVPDFDDEIHYTTTKTFDGIDSAEDFWAWLEGPFVDSLTGATKYKTGNRVETPLAQRTQLHQEGHVDDVTAAYRFSDNDPRSAISDARLRVPVRTGGFDSSKVPRGEP